MIEKLKIGFNKPFLTGNETRYIEEAVASGKLSGNGKFTQLCQGFFEDRFGIKKALLTTSCTDALEMCAILLNIKEGDEVIMPSYTFVSTANAFVLRGAKVIFADSLPDHPNMDCEKLEGLITEKTKAIVCVHYAGMACDMDALMQLAEKHGIFVVEDAAQAIDSTYKGKFLGSIGHLATFSFHETKNIISGEGGMLAINHDDFIDRAEIIWEKGTNRSAFFRGEIDKYNWVDIGSSFLPSEVIAAFLWAQLECLDDIQSKRIACWNQYYDSLLGRIPAKLPSVPVHATNNGHMFYLICSKAGEQAELIDYLKGRGINAVFHYLGLHNSPFYKEHHQNNTKLQMAEYYAEHLVRLPMFYELKQDQIKYITEAVISFYEAKS